MKTTDRKGQLKTARVDVSGNYADGQETPDTKKPAGVLTHTLCRSGNTSLLACMTYWEIAPTGQVDTQLPHSQQVPASTLALPSVTEIAPTGHAPTHDSHPTHAS